MFEGDAIRPLAQKNDVESPQREDVLDVGVLDAVRRGEVAEERDRRRMKGLFTIEGVGGV